MIDAIKQMLYDLRDQTSVEQSTFVTVDLSINMRMACRVDSKDTLISTLFDLSLQGYSIVDLSWDFQAFGDNSCTHYHITIIVSNLFDHKTNIDEDVMGALSELPISGLVDHELA